LPTFEEAQAALNAGGLQGSQLAAAQQSLRNSNRFRALHGNLAPGTNLQNSSEVGNIVGPPPEEQAPSAPSPYDAILKENPIMGGLIQTLQDYMSESNQRASLVEEYRALSQELGIEELNVEAMNLKNIIEGTEDDIRLEVTKAGGFATDSQVLALTNARNKQNIKNYNRLLDTIAAKEKTLNTLIGLEAQDRQAADQRFNNIFNMTAQIAQFQQQFNRDARENLRWTASQPGGLDALQAEYFNNPTSRGLIDKMFGGFEGLQGMARVAQADRARRIALENAQIANIQSQIEQRQKEDELEPISQYAQGQNQRIMQSIFELKDQVGRRTVGAGSTLKFVPGTKARDFKADLDTLKANIAFGQLTAMREASKTGGALGQVSERELGLLESALGGLDQGQSVEAFNDNLDKIQNSILRWNAAMMGVPEGNVLTAPDGSGDIIIIDNGAALTGNASI